MTLEEIKQAVLVGKVVHWKTRAYEVRPGCEGQFNVVCIDNNSTVGLTHIDGATMEEDPEDFYIGK